MIHLIGANGFIGSFIQKEAHALGIHLRIWSHSSSESSQSYFDLYDSDSWTSLLNEKPNNVIFLSWPGLPNYNDAFHVTKNLPACINLVDRLVRNGMSNLVIAGTCYEYGLQYGPLHEDQPANPINTYSIAKDSLRRYIFNQYTPPALKCSWARIFYPYGDGQNPNSIVPSLIRAIQSGDRAFPISSGRQLRDYIPAQKVAEYLLKLSLHSLSHGIYNVASGSPESIIEIVEKVVSDHGSSILLKKGFYPDRSDEPLSFWAHMEKLNSLFSDDN